MIRIGHGLTNLLARIFTEVGCSRIASFSWDQGTGVDPTQPTTLILTLSSIRTKTAQKRTRTRLRRFRTEGEKSPTVLSADHDSQVRTTPIQFLR